MQSSNELTNEGQLLTKSRTYYKSALYLTSTIAIIGSFLLAYLLFFRYERASSLTIYVAVALATVFGLWVQSNVFRFVGGAWFLISVIAIFWPLFSGERIVWGIGTFLFIAIGIFSLGAAYILLLSKNFRVEFYAERASQPAYKKTILKASIIMLIIAAAIATAVDIYHLVTT